MPPVKDKPKAKLASRPEPEDRMDDRAPDRDVIRNRKGEPVSLKIMGNEDQFDFDRRIVPVGWDYQWIAETIYGAPNGHRMVDAAQNGWEPVPAERHDGVFLQKGEKGPIRRGGQILMERDARLTKQAQDLEKKAANDQVGSAFRRAGMQVPSAITDFSHKDAQKHSGVKVERQGFATRSEAEYQYKVDE